MNKTLIGILLLLGLLLLLFFTMRNDRNLYDSLPPRFECATVSNALEGARLFAEEDHIVGNVLGTGSMSHRNYIPAAPDGADPYATTVAFYVLDKTVPFEEVEAGWLCIFSTGGKYTTMHQVAAKLGDVWIMSGNANGSYDGNSRRMSAVSFRGRVIGVFVIIPEL